MTRDPIATLTARITDLNFQILQLTRRIEALEEKGDDEKPARRRPKDTGTKKLDEITCRRLCVVDEEGTERITLEVDKDDNATVEIFEADGTSRILCGAFADGEAYMTCADGNGDSVIAARCTSEGVGTLEMPEDS
jgi:hypothetical protein